MTETEKLLGLVKNLLQEANKDAFGQNGRFIVDNSNPLVDAGFIYKTAVVLEDVTTLAVTEVDGYSDGGAALPAALSANTIFQGQFRTMTVATGKIALYR